MFNLVPTVFQNNGERARERRLQVVESSSYVDLLDDLYELDYNNHTVSQETPALELAQEILGNYKVRAQNVRQDFLQNLTRKSLAFLSDRNASRARERSIDEIVNESMRSVVDEIFDALDPYISQFNRAVVHSDLMLSVTPPALVTEAISYDSTRRPLHSVTSYRARISTCRLSMVVRGQGSKVDFFVIPVERVMALSRIEAEHQPVMSFTGHPRGVLIDWQVEEKPLTSDRLERYCLMMLDYVIDQTRDELSALA